ncbi:glycosyltransferase [Microvirga makkahensis]|uniref:Glycosyltransferase n=1 Tax=Microvirga makkahensis TaxID=1128670 RepID=A0A7X3SPV3_9HYPH|nr:glycosyltransferase [Microvirga makkahensis]MXQ12891.1 glycosyltransferase [Microvirga makkahensis]
MFGARHRATDEAGVFVLSPFTLAPHVNLPLVRSSATLHLARHLSWPYFGNKPLAGTPFSDPDLVLCGAPTLTEVALSLNGRLSLYRLADDSSLFDAVTPAARQAEAEAISRFDGIIVTSSILEERVRKLKARQVLLVSNGVDRAFFERPAPVPAIMTHLQEPRILYAGAIESWFDWNFILHAAEARPNYSFVIVGRLNAPPPAPLPPNVEIVGQRVYADMPAFMQAATVGIIPFALSDRDEAVRAINPLKLYEYLAAGLPVVSSVRAPNLDCRGLFIYSRKEDILTCLDEAIALRRSSTKVSLPKDVDWAEILKDMLKKIGLPYGASERG